MVAHEKHFLLLDGITMNEQTKGYFFLYKSTTDMELESSRLNVISIIIPGVWVLDSVDWGEVTDQMLNLYLNWTAKLWNF